eukprot:Gb_08152 [translate_table: standard]
MSEMSTLRPKERTRRLTAKPPSDRMRISSWLARSHNTKEQSTQIDLPDSRVAGKKINTFELGLVFSLVCKDLGFGFVMFLNWVGAKVWSSLRNKMAKPWGGAGAWAADAEAEEKEKLAGSSVAGEPENFPSLKEAVSSKPKKKNKGQTLSLSELQSGKHVGPGGKSRGVLDAKGLTAEEMMILPTGPRDRTGEEPEYGGLGGGFRDYGRNSRGGDRDRVDSFERRRHDDRGERFDGGGAPISRADEVDNWGSGKKFVPSAAPPDRRSMGFGFNNRDQASDSERWGRRDYKDQALDSERWGRRESQRDDARPTERPRIVLNPPRTGPPSVANSAVSSDVPKPTRANPFGLARPREEVLAEKGKLGSENEARDENMNSSKPTSSHSSCPGTPNLQSESSEEGNEYLKMDSQLEHLQIDSLCEIIVVDVGSIGFLSYRILISQVARVLLGVVVLLYKITKLERCLCFFGMPGAVGAEESVQLGGRGAQGLFLKFESLSAMWSFLRGETDREIKEKEEMNALKDQGTVNGNQPTLRKNSLNEEQQLELIKRDSNDKAHLVQRSGDGPVSAAGQPVGTFEKPGFQSGYPRGKNYDSFERPKYRGGPDVSMRSGEQRDFCSLCVA